MSENFELENTQNYVLLKLFADAGSGIYSGQRLKEIPEALTTLPPQKAVALISRAYAIPRNKPTSIKTRALAPDAPNDDKSGAPSNQ